MKCSQNRQSHKRSCGGCLWRMLSLVIVAAIIALINDRFLKAPAPEGDEPFPQIETAPATATEPPPPPTVTDDLTRIQGIGSVFAHKLRDAGISTFAQLIAASDDELDAIIQPQRFQKLNYDNWRQQAAILSQQPPSPAVDDLTRIQGIGNVFARKLQDAGISTFAQLAAQSPEHLAAICQAPDWRKPDYQSWIYQAQKLSQGSEPS